MIRWDLSGIFPHDLVESFHATLDEIKGADLLLHVVDINDEHQIRIGEVNKVIDELGATSIPQVLVFNKLIRQWPYRRTAGSGQEAKTGSTAALRVSGCQP